MFVGEMDFILAYPKVKTFDRSASLISPFFT
jgi:hypothetical protein